MKIFYSLLLILSAFVLPAHAQTFTIPISATDSLVKISVEKVSRTAAPIPTPPPATTTYKGFGSTTTGGKGFDTVFVTNLNSTGAGSLRAALNAGNRIISFRKLNAGGTIILRAELSGLKNITIDASDAPAPGITINNNNNGNAFAFYNCSNIIVKNLRVRNAGNDCINIVGGTQFIIFGCSVSKFRDGGIDITQGAQNVTIQNCLIDKGASNSNGGMLIAYSPTKSISVVDCIFYGNERTPGVHNANDMRPVPVDYLMADFTNNIAHTWRNFGASVDYGGTLQARGNYFQTVNEPTLGIVINHETGDAGKAKLYAAGNVSGNAGANVNRGNIAVAWPVPETPVADACANARRLLAVCGPRPLDAEDNATIGRISLTGCPL